MIVRSRNVLAPARAVSVVQLMRFATHAAALPVALDAGTGNPAAVYLVAPASARVAVETVWHRCRARRGGNGRCRASSEKKRKHGRNRDSPQTTPEHQKPLVLSDQTTPQMDRTALVRLHLQPGINTGYNSACHRARVLYGLYSSKSLTSFKK